MNQELCLLDLPGAVRCLEAMSPLIKYTSPQGSLCGINMVLL